MANPDLISGFDINDTNTDTIPDTLIDNGYSELQVVESKHYNKMFKQLFAAANKNRNDGVWEWEDPATNDTENSFKTRTMVKAVKLYTKWIR
jgi:flagellar motor component MotA